MTTTKTKADRAARVVAERRATILKTAEYLDTKTLTPAEKGKLTKLRKDCESGKSLFEIRKFAAPFYRGDARQIAALLKDEYMFPKEAAKFERAVSKAESGVSYLWPADSYRDLVALADLNNVEVPTLATVRGKPSRNTESDRTSGAKFFPMPR